MQQLSQTAGGRGMFGFLLIILGIYGLIAGVSGQLSNLGLYLLGGIFLLGMGISNGITAYKLTQQHRTNRR